MKQNSSITAIKNRIKKFFISAILIALILTPNGLFAQADSTQIQEPASEEEASLLSPSMQFIGVQKADNSIDLKIVLQAKVDGLSKKLGLLKVNFIQLIDDTEKELGFAITNGEGKAILNLKPEAIIPDKDGKLHFKAVFAGNKVMESVEEEVSFKRARLEIIAVPDDSLYNVQVKLTNVSTGEEIPVPETTIGIFVKRSFNPLKIGEGNTDENGEALIEIPGNLPGDANGNITLLAKLDESEDYGYLEAAIVQKWGVPVSANLEKLPRSLWSTDPPLWMMVTFIILMCTVWGHYLVIGIQLFRLRKEEPDPDSPTVEHLS